MTDNSSELRREALRRTREMHRQNPRPQAVQAESGSEEKNREDNSTSPKNPPSGNRTDGDRFILLILIVLLAREGADLKLLMALGYIMM